jgi:hypothetical protein
MGTPFFLILSHFLGFINDCQDSLFSFKLFKKNGGGGATRGKENKLFLKQKRKIF